MTRNRRSCDAERRLKQPSMERSGKSLKFPALCKKLETKGGRNENIHKKIYS